MWSFVSLRSFGRATVLVNRIYSFQNLVIKNRSKIPAQLLIKVERVINSASKFKKITLLGSALLINATCSPGTRPSLTKSDISRITNEADALYDENKFEKILDLLRPYKESGIEELIWRLSRAAFKMSKKQGLSKGEHAALIEEAYSMAKLALELNDKSARAHKWMSCILNDYSGLRGFKAQCSTLLQIKEHMLKSIELDPSDATVIYMLGMWYYGIADIAWYQRQILNAIVGSSLSASFEEALTYFKKAEETSPNFYSLNLLMLGKSHLKLGDTETAIFYLQQAAVYPQHTEDDHQAHKEASELLAKLKKT